MRKTWIIAWRDFKSYFTSPIAYIVLAAFLFIMGWMFFNTLAYFNIQSMQYKQFGGMGGGRSPSITQELVRPLYGNMNVILLFLLPFLTMRLLAEEKKSHTIELLLTAPVTLKQAVLAKFISSYLFVALMLALTFIFPAVLFVTGNPDAGPVFTSILGTFLLAGCYLSVGLLCSALTENQIVAGVLTFALLLFFWLISWAAQSAGQTMGEVLRYLSLIGHFNNFSRGIVDTTDLVFYFSFMGFALFLTHRILDSFRWR